MSKYRMPILALAVALIFNATALGASTSQEEQRSMYNIRITLGDRFLSASLEDSAATRDFMAQLPLTLDLEDYSATEKIAYLPHKLATHGAPSGIDPEVGDVTYYAPWGNLALFYRDFGYSAGLVRLGRITAGLEHLDYRGSKLVKIERIPTD